MTIPFVYRSEIYNMFFSFQEAARLPVSPISDHYSLLLPYGCLCRKLFQLSSYVQENWNRLWSKAIVQSPKKLLRPYFYCRYVATKKKYRLKLSSYKEYFV